MTDHDLKIAELSAKAREGKLSKEEVSFVLDQIKDNLQRLDVSVKKLQEMSL